MTEPVFDHDRLDVDRLRRDLVTEAKSLDGLPRHARDRRLRAAQSIPLNIAEGNGKRSLKNRNRFLNIARGPAFERAAIPDAPAATDGLNDSSHRKLKSTLKRIESMLTRLISRADAVSEPTSEYEYRRAEYEYDGV